MVLASEPVGGRSRATELPCLCVCGVWGGGGGGSHEYGYINNLFWKIGCWRLVLRSCFFKYLF